ncbi:hypothetical protein [Cupriavidus necator]
MDHAVNGDKAGILARRTMECVDADYQTIKSRDGACVREHFFNTPELKALVAGWSDDDIQALNRAVLVQPSGLLANSSPKCRIASRRPVSH